MTTAAPTKPRAKPSTSIPREWPRVGFVSLPSLMYATGFSRSFVYKLIGRGKLPRPKKFGTRSLWDASELRRDLGLGE
jgi:predicted DNA-binding transcriptional regulator AlpA